MTSTDRTPTDPTTLPGPWNAVATGYDESFFALAERLAGEAVASARLGPAVSLLDVATGPGTFAVRAAPHVARVVAIDFAEAMIERLRGNLDAEGITNVEALQMDGHDLQLDDDSFDVVVSMFGWFLFSDRVRGLAEMRRVLRPGGRLLVTSWATPDKNAMLGLGMEALRAALPDLPRPSKPPATQDPETCGRELREAGFVDVECRVVEQEMELASAGQYWNMFERGGAPVAVLRERLGEAAWHAASERAAAALTDRLGTGPVRLRCAAIFTTGQRP